MRPGYATHRLSASQQATSSPANVTSPSLTPTFQE